MPVSAGDRERPAVDRQADLSHLTPLPPRCARFLRERHRRARRSRRQSLSAPDHRLSARRAIPEPAVRLRPWPRAALPPFRAGRGPPQAYPSATRTTALLPSVHLLEFSQAAGALGSRFAGEGARPQGPGNLADIEVAT